MSKKLKGLESELQKVNKEIAKEASEFKVMEAEHAIDKAGHASETKLLYEIKEKIIGHIKKEKSRINKLDFIVNPAFIPLHNDIPFMRCEIDTRDWYDISERKKPTWKSVLLCGLDLYNTDIYYKGLDVKDTEEEVSGSSLRVKKDVYAKYIKDINDIIKPKPVTIEVNISDEIIKDKIDNKANKIKLTNEAMKEFLKDIESGKFSIYTSAPGRYFPPKHNHFVLLDWII